MQTIMAYQHLAPSEVLLMYPDFCDHDDNDQTILLNIENGLGNFHFLHAPKD